MRLNVLLVLFLTLYASSLFGHRVARNVCDRVVAGQYLVRLAVRDLDGKLLLDGHHELDRVEAVEAEVLLEHRCRGYLQGGQGYESMACNVSQWRTRTPRGPPRDLARRRRTHTLDASTLSNALTTPSTRSVTSALSRYDVAKVLLIIDPNTGADSVRWAATGVPIVRGEDATVLSGPDFAERKALSTSSAA